MTGYWVSLVTEDWRYRMTTAPKGDVVGVPLNPAGRRIAEAWDPAKDEAEGEQCKAYGAGGLMRLPTRLNITWEDDNTLKIETDAGTQTRILHFADSQGQSGTWQGVGRELGAQFSHNKFRPNGPANATGWFAQSCDDENEIGIFAQKRRAL